jgi:nitroreductase
MLKDLVRRNRSCRRFQAGTRVELATLRELVDLARLSASAANLQPLRYVLCCEPETNAAIFECLAWAGYLKEWPGPGEGERPAGYVVVLGDTTTSQTHVGVDAGLAMQSILLGAVERGLGGCIIASVQRDPLRRILDIPEQSQILYVIALGEPGEMVTIEEIGPEGDIKYWRDGESVHHVPKRRLTEVILDERGA